MPRNEPQVLWPQPQAVLLDAASPTASLCTVRCSHPLDAHGAGLCSQPPSRSRSRGCWIWPSTFLPTPCSRIRADGEGQVGNTSLPRDGENPSPASTHGSSEWVSPALLAGLIPFWSPSPSYCPQVWEILWAPQSWSLPSGLPRAAPCPAPAGL